MFILKQKQPILWQNLKEGHFRRQREHFELKQAKIAPKTPDFCNF